ncbi:MULTISPECIES: hypothetical protein [Methylococcus]|uniref:ODP domain-containing protein n=1 Tax=Methylococcus capsulatus TaxID=414 RepID=A0ABZ2F662_METCP|nr:MULTISPECIES: hypothetical protein [Methylococcus]
MTITNKQSGTNVHEVAEGIYRTNTPVVSVGTAGFSFNQYLIVDDESLLFHTGPRKMFPLVHEAVAYVLPVERLRYIAFSHVEADERGSLNEWLGAAPHSLPLCGTMAAGVSVHDLADRAPHAVADGGLVPLGKHTVRWLDAPQLPHAWDCGFLMEDKTRQGHCSVATCSRRKALIFRPSRNRTFSGRARRFAMKWITPRTPKTPARCLRDWHRRTRRRSRACMAAHGVVMAEPATCSRRCAFFMIPPCFALRPGRVVQRRHVPRHSGRTLNRWAGSRRLGLDIGTNGHGVYHRQ